MRRVSRFLLRALTALVVLVLIVVGVRLINGWRFGSESDADPQDLASYELEHEGMSIEQLDGDYLSGFHLVPDEVSRDGVVVTFGGSDGGPDFERAVELAGEGYEVYALFFFGQDGQPSELDRVPLEFFDEVTARIEEEIVRPGPVTVIGTSKGAELALLLAAEHEVIDNVVTFAPTMHAYQSLKFGAETTSSWTLDGEDVPYLSFQRASIGSTARMFAALAFNYPVAYRSTYVSVVERAPAEEEAAARLDPDAVSGSLLVFAGGDDEMWQSDTAAQQIQEAAPEAEVHLYPQAGHAFSGEGHWGGLAMGGAAEASRGAARGSAAVLHERLATWHGCALDAAANSLPSSADALVDQRGELGDGPVVTGDPHRRRRPGHRLQGEAAAPRPEVQGLSGAGHLGSRQFAKAAGSTGADRPCFALSRGGRAARLRPGLGGRRGEGPAVPGEGVAAPSRAGSPLGLPAPRPPTVPAARSPVAGERRSCGRGWATGTSRLLPARGRVPRHRLISTVTGSWPSGARSALATGVVSAQLGTQSSWAGHITSIMCCSPARATDGAIRVTGASAASSASTRWMVASWVCI